MLNSNQNRRQSGFTLVEILIVVVILGILAAIVIPQFTNASEDAKASSVITQLQTIRSQLELYQIQHNGSYPAADLDHGGGEGEWSALTDTTEVDGSEGDGTNDYGTYLQRAPTNPFEDSSTVATTAASGVGWVYTASTGEIKVVMPAAKAAALDLDTTNDVAVY